MGGLTRLEFKARSIIKRIALRLLDADQHVLSRLNALRILHRGIDLTENAQIVKFLLSAQKIALTQRIGRLYLQFVVDDVRPRIFPSGDQDAIHVKALAFVDFEHYIHVISERGRGFSLKGRAWEAVVKVIIQNNVAIVGDPGIRERLSGTGVQILKRRVSKLSASDNLKCTYSRLWAFVDAYGHRQFVFHAPIVVFGTGFHLYLRELIVAVH